MALGDMIGGTEATPNTEDSTPTRRKSPKWTTKHNLVLLIGWIKYEIDSVVERQAVRDQPRYGIQVGGNTRYWSIGSKRSAERYASDSSYVGSVARPMGRDATKKKGKKKGKGAALEVVNEECNEFKQIKVQELERLGKITMRQEEANHLMKERTEAKKMKMYLKLSEKEHLKERSKELLEKLSHDLFGN
ncbi:PREDICTED: uncharacterized protein LOC104753437 [Camelina sativa]|uniref:Uncharacterized protein LOC104753437 n=1 Tax=Camelina sativa TaxID=90675 RepID=A0ABM1R2L1_CAMSA|nr:PREDICTED: uncharacterized protein LOC104753437 [Camelina sativa]